MPLNSLNPVLKLIFYSCLFNELWPSCSGLSIQLGIVGAITLSNHRHAFPEIHVGFSIIWTSSE
jgi:hypothetical protein